MLQRNVDHNVDRKRRCVFEVGCAVVAPIKLNPDVVSSGAHSLPLINVVVAGNCVALAAWPSLVLSVVVFIQKKFVVSVHYQEETGGVCPTVCAVLIVYYEGPDVSCVRKDL